jgi:broad specificity phosphatase PhoE
MVLLLSRRLLLGRLAVLCTPFRAIGSTLPAQLDVGTKKPQLELPPLAQGWRRLYLCRHGETEWNAQNRIQGATDVALNANGRRQAERLAVLLADSPIDLVVSSKLSRASDTADAVAKLHPAARRVRDARFNEICFGSLEGQPLEAGSPVRAAYDGIVKRWARGETGLPLPGAKGESPDSMAARSMAALRGLGLLPPLDGGSPVPCPRHVCLVAHGRHNKILLAALSGDVSRCNDFQQGNTCVNVIDIATSGEARLLLTDFRGHLRAASDGA